MGWIAFVVVMIIVKIVQTNRTNDNIDKRINEALSKQVQDSYIYTNAVSNTWVK